MTLITSQPKTSGTITILGDIIPDEVRCPYLCNGGDICVSTITGDCAFCGRVFNIHTAEVEIKSTKIAPPF
jgi:hypothetical protein